MGRTSKTHRNRKRTPATSAQRRSKRKETRQVFSATGQGDRYNEWDRTRQEARLATTTALFWNKAVAGAKHHQATDLIYAFYGTRNPYPCSNHTLCPVRFEGKDYKSVEHGYLALQAQCYGLTGLQTTWTEARDRTLSIQTHRDRLMRWNAANPKHVKSWSTWAFRDIKRRNGPAVQEWASKKNQLMFRIVLAKFQQNREMALKLLQTGDTFILELSPYDKYWGVGKRLTEAEVLNGPPSKDWGENRLGLILMGVRDNLRRQQFDALPTRPSVLRSAALEHAKRAVEMCITEGHDVPQGYFEAVRGTAQENPHLLLPHLQEAENRRYEALHELGVGVYPERAPGKCRYEARRGNARPEGKVGNNPPPSWEQAFEVQREQRRRQKELQFHHPEVVELPGPSSAIRH